MWTTCLISVALTSTLFAASYPGKFFKPARHQTFLNTNYQTDSNVPAGTWGGDHIELEITENGATVEFDCARGTISQRLKVGQDNRFEIRGSFVQEHAGPVLSDESSPARPAIYSGQLNGKKMTLRITLTDSSEKVGTFSLTHDVPGTLTKCR